jgi:hypothetical protein
VVNKIVNTTSPGFFTAKVPRTPRNLKLGVLGVLAVVQYLLDHYTIRGIRDKKIPIIKPTYKTHSAIVLHCAFLLYAGIVMDF